MPREWFNAHAAAARPGQPRGQCRELPPKAMDRRGGVGGLGEWLQPRRRRSGCNLHDGGGVARPWINAQGKVEENGSLESWLHRYKGGFSGAACPTRVLLEPH